VVAPDGATLGSTTTVAKYFHVYAIDNAGTVELALSGSHLFDEGIVHSTTIINASSDSGSILYSTTARTDVAIRYLGRFYGFTTTDSWDDAPTEQYAGREQPSSETCYINVDATLMQTYLAATTSFKTQALNNLEGYCSWASISSNQLSISTGIYEITVPVGSYASNDNVVLQTYNVTGTATLRDYGILVSSAPTGVLAWFDVTDTWTFTSAMTIEFQTKTSSTAGAYREYLGRIKITRLKGL